MALCDALDIPFYQVLAVAFKKSETGKETEKTVQQVLISNDFRINGEPVNRKAKEMLAKINEHVTTCDWSPSTKVRELYVLSELIDQFKVSL